MVQMTSRQPRRRVVDEEKTAILERAAPHSRCRRPLYDTPDIPKQETFCLLQVDIGANDSLRLASAATASLGVTAGC